MGERWDITRLLGNRQVTTPNSQGLLIFQSKPEISNKHIKLHYNMATLMINLENLISRRRILCISKKRQSYHRRTVVPWPALNVSFSSL